MDGADEMEGTSDEPSEGGQMSTGQVLSEFARLYVDSPDEFSQTVQQIAGSGDGGPILMKIAEQFNNLASALMEGASAGLPRRGPSPGAPMVEA